MSWRTAPYFHKERIVDMTETTQIKIKMVKGGCLQDINHQTYDSLRAGTKDWYDKDYTIYFIGFRVVKNEKNS